MTIHFDYAALQQATSSIFGDSIIEPVSKRLGNPTLPVTGNRIDVPLREVDTPGMVWIHDEGGDPQSVSMALNSGPGAISQKIYGSFILVRKTHLGWVVAGTDYQRQAEYMHGASIRPQTSVVLGQFDFGLLQPTAPDRSMKCLVSEGVYYIGDTPYVVATQETQDFTSDIPGTAGEALAVLVTVDPTTGQLYYTVGSSTFDASLSHREAFLLNYPQNSDPTRFTIGWVRLVNGMSAILEATHIYPAQELMSKTVSGSGAPAIEDVFCARLTLTSGDPVMSSEVFNATEVFISPYKGNRLCLFNGLTSEWETLYFDEITLDTTTFTLNKNYDIFTYIDLGSVGAEVEEWTNNTTRAEAITEQDGRVVKSSDPTRRLVGTIGITDVAGECECSLKRMLVSNLYHPQPRAMRFESPDAGWNCDTGWRQAKDDPAYQLEYVSCLNEQPVDAEVRAVIAVDGGAGGAVGIGLDSISTRVARQHASAFYPNAGLYLPITASYNGWTGVGRHTLIWMETADGGMVSFLGNDTLREHQSVLKAMVWG